MPANFNLVLDTTGPQGVGGTINAGATYATARDVSLGPTTTDPDTTGYQVKVWGDVDLAADANIQDTEANSSWINLTAAVAVRLAAGDGVKNLTWRLRDDVWNESATATDAITLDTTVPVVTVTGPDVAKVSKIAGKRTASISFSVDTHIQAWKVKVVPATGSIHTAGTQIGVANGSTSMTGGALAASTPQAATIDGRDLEAASAGDGTKIVKVFVQDDAGNWSV
jgi:hypothetical protein